MATNHYHMTTEKNDMENEKKEHEIYECKLKLRKHIIKIMYSALMGVILMYLFFTMESDNSRSINNSIIIEVIKVGGWMFMWQAFQTLAFDVPDRIKKINTLNKSRIVNKYN